MGQLTGMLKTFSPGASDKIFNFSRTSGRGKRISGILYLRELWRLDHSRFTVKADKFLKVRGTEGSEDLTQSKS